MCTQCKLWVSKSDCAITGTAVLPCKGLASTEYMVDIVGLVWFSGIETGQPTILGETLQYYIGCSDFVSN